MRLTGDAPTRTDLLQVSGNTIHGFAKSGASRHGIVVEKRAGGIVQANLIHHVNAGIWLREGSRNLKVLDNHVQDCDGADVRDEGRDNVIRRA